MRINVIRHPKPTHLPPVFLAKSIKVVLYGRSLGTAVMVNLASESGARGLILSNSFTSLPDVLAAHPWIPVWPFKGHTVDSAATFTKYHGPLLITHGDSDLLIPQQLGMRLFELANDPKQFVSLPGEGHDDMDVAYYAALDRFIGSLPEVNAAAVSEISP
jgi:pimeloyl-ACP methyl ester carboxylesterase